MYDSVLEALLDSFQRNNTILLNLLRALPEGGMDARAMEGSPSVGEQFTHIQNIRLFCYSRLRRSCSRACLNTSARRAIAGWPSCSTRLLESSVIW